MTTVAGPDRKPRRHVESLEPRKTQGFKIWATIGAIYCLVGLYAMSTWVFSSDFTPVEQGPDDPPTYTIVAIRVMEVIALPMAVAMVWIWGIKPWRRDRRLPTDMVLIISCCMLWWMDAMYSYTQVTFMYNTYHLNWGSWLGNIPGSLPPEGNRWAEGIVGWGPAYVWGLFGPMVLGCFIMQKCRAKWPRMGNFGLFGIVFLFWLAWDVTVEPIFIALGVFAYPYSLGSLSLWPGTRMQFPLYEVALTGVWYGLFAAVRWFRDDRGRTVFEKGIADLNLSPGREGLLRVMTMTGVLGSIYLVCYMAPSNFFAARADSSVPDMPSYLTPVEMCGPGTQYPCPGEGVPVIRRDTQMPVQVPPPASPTDTTVTSP